MTMSVRGESIPFSAMACELVQRSSFEPCSSVSKISGSHSEESDAGQSICCPRIPVETACDFLRGSASVTVSFWAASLTPLLSASKARISQSVMMMRYACPRDLVVVGMMGRVVHGSRTDGCREDAMLMRDDKEVGHSH